MKSFLAFWSITLLVSCSSGNQSPNAPPDAAPAIDGESPGLDAGSDIGDAGVSLPPLSWRSCDTSGWPSGYPLPPAGAECASLSVPIDHAKPAGEVTTLEVLRKKSQAFPSDKAVFVIEGGPGGSSIFTSGITATAFPELASSFDLVFVDLRGTGRSGYLACPEPAKTTQDWIACGQSQAGVDLNQVLSLAAAHDLEAARKRMGYDKTHLYAVSYGTRVAFEYLRLFPESSAAAVLDGVAPPMADLFSDTITSADRGLGLLVSDCNADPACLAVSPNLAADLAARRAALAKSPRPISAGGVKTFETEQDFMAFVRALLRYWYPRYKLPRAIHEAVQGNSKLYDQLLSQLLGTTVTESTGSAPKPAWQTRATRTPAWPSPRRRLLGEEAFGAEVSSPVVYLSMLCAESFPNSPGLASLEALWSEQSWASRAMVEKAGACASWPVSAVPASQRQPLTSSARVLLMSGAIDVNVDPKWAASALDTLSQAQHVVIPFATHLPSEENGCAARVAEAYLAADGDYEKVDSSCVKALAPPGWN